jgi:cell division protein FtsL
MNVNGFQHKQVETFFIFKIEINILILYVLTCLVIVVISVIIVKIRSRIIMYEPEIAKKHSPEEDDKNL